jgi:hypothetical protein
VAIRARSNKILLNVKMQTGFRLIRQMLVRWVRPSNSFAGREREKVMIMLYSILYARAYVQLLEPRRT